ncbi:dephospho- kinase [Chlorella sorokiniana]|uniref:Dephospho-kinase n=1 Tax=Chlorella sorokiniana TaxID=3076 RepID=A0A2P6TWC5_CHLSO|nr:dephospho- kinase [Chlorella sorokiniana]|eukprot:PRW58367.1 dephospho- kinase [Chlorella sorokiniana]
MRLVGLTGGIACGKSTVSRALAAQGFTIIDADAIARAVVDRGRWGYRRVVRAFGSGILRSDGEIDREALAALVFADAAARQRLNAASFPAIGLELARQILLAWVQCQPAVIIDMPLLFESGFYLLTRPRVLVACSPATQLSRLMQRDTLERAAAEARMAAQMPLETKRRRADIVLENDGSMLELEAQVEVLVARLRRHAWLQRCLLSPLGLLAGAAAAAALWLRQRWPPDSAF